jgi:hypothetical protein
LGVAVGSTTVSLGVDLGSTTAGLIETHLFKYSLTHASTRSHPISDCAKKKAPPPLQHTLSTTRFRPPTTCFIP